MKITQKRLASGALVMMMAAGCQQSPHFQEGATVKRTGQPDVDPFGNDNKVMNAAIAKARATVPTFIKALRSPRPGQSSFAIKKRFQDGGDAEHMWISGLSFDGKAFHGLLNNVPINVPSVKAGDAVSCAPAEISDWMFIDGGKLIGGATIRVAYNQRPPAEQKQFLKESGYHF